MVAKLKEDGLDDEVFGADILFDALAEPMRQIAENGALGLGFVLGWVWGVGWDWVLGCCRKASISFDIRPPISFFSSSFSPTQL